MASNPVLAHTAELSGKASVLKVIFQAKEGQLVSVEFPIGEVNTDIEVSSVLNSAFDERFGEGYNKLHVKTVHVNMSITTIGAKPVDPEDAMIEFDVDSDELLANSGRTLYIIATMTGSFLSRHRAKAACKNLDALILELKAQNISLSYTLFAELLGVKCCSLVKALGKTVEHTPYKGELVMKIESMIKAMRADPAMIKTKIDEIAAAKLAAKPEQPVGARLHALPSHARRRP